MGLRPIPRLLVRGGPCAPLGFVASRSRAASMLDDEHGGRSESASRPTEEERDSTSRRRKTSRAASRKSEPIPTFRKTSRSAEARRSPRCHGGKTTTGTPLVDHPDVANQLRPTRASEERERSDVLP